MTSTTAFPKTVIELARRRAGKTRLSLEEYLIDLIIQDLNPEDRALEYIRAARELLEEAEKKLEKNNIRQVAEKTWEVAALIVKAYA